MYKANNHKELKKLLKEDKFPIYITDSDTIKVVETLESLKQKGIVVTAKDKLNSTILGRIIKPTTCDAIAETTVVVLAIITATALISLYALWMKKNIKVRVNPDGTVTIETRD